MGMANVTVRLDSARLAGKRSKCTLKLSHVVHALQGRAQGVESVRMEIHGPTGSRANLPEFPRFLYIRAVLFMAQKKASTEAHPVH